MLTDEKLAYYKRCYTREGWADLHVSRRVMRDLIEEIERLRDLSVVQAEEINDFRIGEGLSEYVPDVAWDGAVAGAGAVS